MFQIDWPIAGSLYATSVKKALIKTDTSSLPELDDRVLEEYCMPTYAALTESIYEAVDGLNPFWDRHKILFSAQDDEWSLDWRTRSVKHAGPVPNYYI